MRIEVEHKPMLIGIAGYARSGKDTIFSYFQKFHEEEGHKMARIAFADRLKKDINPFLQKNLGISSFCKDDQSKKVIRPILVAYGEAQRVIDTDHWIKKIERDVDFLLQSCVSVCITDVRYSNEAQWVSSNGILVCVDRSDIKPPNESELKNSKSVRKMAEVILDWPEIKDEKQREIKAKQLYKEVINAYREKFKLHPRFTFKN